MHLLGASTNLDLKSYDEGTARGNREAPRLLREHDLGERRGGRNLVKLVHDPRTAGMGVTIYDPKFNPDRRGASLLVNILANAFRRLS